MLARIWKMLLCAAACVFAAATGIQSFASDQERALDATTEVRSLGAPDAEGFVQVIGNDDDLKLWKGLAGYWHSSSDRILTGHQSLEQARQTFLVLPIELRDFEFRLKYRFMSAEGNSGLQFRSKLVDPEGYRVAGYQADFDATGNFDGSIYEEGGRGALSARGDKTEWDQNNRQKRTPFADTRELLKSIRVGDWNDLVVVAKGAHVTYEINGQLMTELVDESPNGSREGVLALQLHEGIAMTVQFKEGKLRLLDRPTEPKTDQQMK